MYPLESPSPRPGRRFVLILFGIFGLALGVRILFLWQIRDAPPFNMLFVDSREYDQWARRIVAGDLLGSGVFYQAPLYPYFLALIYTLAGAGLTAVRIVQILLGSASCVFLALAGRRFFGPAAGVASGVLLALYPTAIFFDALLHKSVLDTLFFSLLLWVLSFTLRGAKAGHGWWAGLLLGAFTLTRENAMALAPIVVLWFAWLLRRSRPAFRIRTLGFLVLGFFLALSPVAVRNRLVGGQFFLTTSSAGAVFYGGNSATSRGTVGIFEVFHQSPAEEGESVRAEAERALGRKLTPREVSRYWWGKAGDFIRTQPVTWLRLMARKALLLVNTVEVSDTYDQYTYGDWSALLRLLTLLFPFGMLFPLASAGVFLARGLRREVALLFALVVVYGGTVVLFQVSARYRYPLVIPLILFAGVGLSTVAHEVRLRRRRALLLALIPAGLAAFLAHLPVAYGLKPGMRAVMLSNIASHYLKQPGGTGRALPLLEEALRLSPAYFNATFNMAVALRDAGRPAEAIVYMRKAGLISPSPVILAELGHLHHMLGQVPEAARSFKEALAEDPRLVSAWYGLALLLQDTGKTQDAVKCYQKALEIEPRYPLVHYNLGLILLDAGRIEEAAGHFREALRWQPDYAAAHRGLGVAMMRQEKPAEAAAHFRDALRLDPGDREARAYLEQAELRAGAGGSRR